MRRFGEILVLALIASVLHGCSKGKEAPPAPTPAGGLGAVRPQAEPIRPQAEPSAEDRKLQEFAAFTRRLDAAPSLAAAVELVRPYMDDTANKTSNGAMYLTRWAKDHLKWDEVAVKKNETSFAKIRKDSDEERGKHMCITGGIVQIAKVTKGVYSGLLLTNYGQDILSFMSAGSTGELVRHSIARFCGVVIGTYDYNNSGGGVGHAVALVGMFDLPENRGQVEKKKARKDEDDGDEG